MSRLYIVCAQNWLSTATYFWEIIRIESSPTIRECVPKKSIVYAKKSKYATNCPKLLSTMYLVVSVEIPALMSYQVLRVASVYVPS